MGRATTCDGGQEADGRGDDGVSGVQQPLDREGEGAPEEKRIISTLVEAVTCACTVCSAM